jgi:EmrB/QacA subfamily drug resistance transporter
VLSRILQALGGGVISTTSLAMIAEIFSKKERNMAISIYGMGVLIGPASGPTLGGYLTNAFGWRSVFMINIPIGIITVLLGMEIIERDQPKGTSGKKFDIYGYLTLITFIISLMLAMSKGEDDGWTSPEIIMYFLTALISFTLFLFIESKVKDKIIELSLFKIPTLTAGLAVTIGRSLTLYCAMFMTPLFVQQQLGYSSFQSGLLFLPSDIFLVFAMPLIGKFGDKFSPRLLGILGLSLLSVSMLLYTNINIDTNQWGLLTATFIRALGQAMLMGPMGALILSSVPKEKTAMTSSLFSMIMYVAGSLGIALFGSLLTNRAHFHLGVIGQAFNAGTVSFNSILADVFNQIHGLGFSGVDSTLISKSLIIQKVTQAATILSFQDSFLVAGMIPLLLILTTFMLPGKAKHTDKKSMAPAGK